MGRVDGVDIQMLGWLVAGYEWMDGWMDGCTDAWLVVWLVVDGWMDGWVDDRCLVGCVVGCGWMDGSVDGQMLAWLMADCGWMDGWTDAWLVVWLVVDWWMDGWTDKVFDSLTVTPASYSAWPTTIDWIRSHFCPNAMQGKLGLHSPGKASSHSTALPSFFIVIPHVCLFYRA